MRPRSDSAIRPIRDDAGHAAALREIEELWGAEEGTDAADRLDVLATLVEAYEEARHAITPPDPLEAIAFRLEQQGLDRRALVGVIGNRSRVHEVLAGRRPLTLAMIRRLRDRFGIPADILIGQTSHPRSAA